MSRKKKKHRKITGYRLHHKRLLYAATQLNKKLGGKRTIKYPLARNEDNKEFWDSLARAIQEDYTWMVGPFQVSTYIQEKYRYSIFDFYLDTLRLGFIFSSKPQELYYHLFVLTGKDPLEHFRQRIKNTNSTFYAALPFEQDSFANLFLKEIALKRGDFRGTKELSQFVSSFLDNLHLTLSPTQRSEAESALKEIHTVLYRSGLSKAKRVTALKERFGIVSPFEIGISDYPTLFPVDIFYDQNATPDSIFNFWDQALKENNWQEELLPAILGAERNAWSYYLKTFFKKLHEGSIDDLQKMFLQVDTELGFHIWKGREVELLKRLQILADKVSVIPLKPFLAESIGIISDWGEYRTTIAGKIESWISNTRRQKNEALHLLSEKHLPALRNLIRAPGPEEIKGLAGHLLKIGELIKTKGNTSAMHTLYMQNLASLRTLLNQAIQQGGYSEDIREILKKDLPRPPAFVGHVKKRHLAKYVKAPTLIRDLVRFVINDAYPLQNYTHLVPEEQDIIFSKYQEDPQYVDEKIRKVLDLLLTKSFYNTSSIANQVIHALFVELHLLEIWQEFTYTTKEKGIEGWRKRLYRSPYQTRKGYQKLLPEHTFTDADYINLFESLAINWEKYLQQNPTPEDLIAFIELEKIRAGLAFDFTAYDTIDTSHWRIREYPLKEVEALSSVYEYFQQQSSVENIPLDALRKMTQLILSEVSGLAKLWSKKVIVERFTLSFIKSNERLPLVFQKASPQPPCFRNS